MDALITRLIGEGPIVTDGAWGTMLQAEGLPAGSCPDEWNLSHPVEVHAVARRYVDAGSRIILTNTFGANSFVLEKHGLADRAAEINRAGARLSQRAAEGRALVFASLGPTGKLVMMGEVGEDSVRRAYEEQAEALAEGGADGLVIETMSDLAETRAAIQAARGTGLPVVACMSFDSGPAGLHTMMGVSIVQAAESLGQAGADVIGANCGNGIDAMPAVCRALRAATALPIWIKGNAGKPRLEGSRTVYDMTPEAFAAFVPMLIDAGAAFIGGCCGTDSHFIERVATDCSRARVRRAG